MNRGRSQKRRGYVCEKRIEARLAPFGFKRMVMSGALGGEHAGDLRRADKPRMPNIGIACVRPAAISIIEVKQRKDGQTFLRKALAQGEAHAVVVDPAGGQEPLFVLTLSRAIELLKEAGYQVSDAPISHGEAI